MTNYLTKQNYEFETIEELSNFRYNSTYKIDRSKESLFYTSYLSNAKDANRSTLLKLQKHKETIDLAIKMAEKQYKEGLRWPLIVFPRDLVSSYHWQVYQHVEAKCKNKAKNRITGSQPYWVYSKHIKTYEFRTKDLNSKFQAFIEFIPSYSSTKVVKVNLRMSKKGYSQRHVMFKDGFDLVYSTNEVKVRHVSEQIVTTKEYNKIDKYMMIDAWANIHTVLIDKNDTNVDEYGRPRFNIDKKVICGLKEKYTPTKFIKKRLQLIKSCKNTEKYWEYLNSLIPSIKARVESLVELNNEAKVTLLIASNSNSKFYSDLERLFYEELQNACAKKGITFEVIEQSKEKLQEVVKVHKEKANKYIQKIGFGKSYDLSEHVRWEDYLLACLLIKYKDFYPILKKGGKFSIKPVETTDNEKSQVLKPPRPSYIAWSTWKKLMCMADTSFEVMLARQSWLKDVKAVAKEYYLELTNLNKEVTETVPKVKWV